MDGENPDITLVCQLVFLWFSNNAALIIQERLPEVIDTISKKMSVQAAINVLARLEVSLDYRKPSLGIYDHALHVIGGAQKYGCTIAHILQDWMDITLITNKPVTLDRLQKWYNLDLHKCRIAHVPIPFFEQRVPKTELLDPSDVDQKKENPFHLISRISGRFDFFINNPL